MVNMTVIAQLKSEKQLEFRQTVESLFGGGQEAKEEGLRKTSVYQDVNEPTGFRLILEWKTQKDLEKYLKAGNFWVLLGALKVLCTESEIRYSTPPPEKRGPGFRFEIA